MKTNHSLNSPDLDAEIIRRSMIKAADQSVKPYILYPSNFDYLLGREAFTYFYTYLNPKTGDFSSITASIKTSLADILDHYFPLAGRVVRNPNTGSMQVLCNNEGVEMIETRANIALGEVNFFDLNKFFKKLMLPLTTGLALSVHVVGYTCGGFSVIWTCDHLLMDAYSFNMFITLWSEIGRTRQISRAPSHDRMVFRPRTAPVHNPQIGRLFVKCNQDELINVLAGDIFLKRLYYVDESTVDRLQALCSQGEKGKRSRAEALSVYLWKALATVVGESGGSNCRMGWFVDGRIKMHRTNKNAFDYVGNLLTMAVAESGVEELRKGSLSEVAAILSRAITGVITEEHFLELLDWVETQKPVEMIVPEILRGLGPPAIVVSACHQLPVKTMNFGYGQPVVGSAYWPGARFGAGFVNIGQSARGDRSLVVFATIWPELAAALESEPQAVFQPLTSAHLGMGKPQSTRELFSRI